MKREKNNNITSNTKIFISEEVVCGICQTKFDE